MPAKFELIAPCFFGCESTAKFELTRIGAENIRVGDGRLTFAGGPEMIAAANLNLRTVERVMLLLARYRAATFDDLFDGVYDIPWEELLPADAAFPVSGSTEVWCFAIRRLTTAFLMMLWQAGTLDSWLFSEEPVTGKAASAGSSSSQWME